MKKPKNKDIRLYYIDNLRIFLISLVVLLHLNITYGAPGDWYYNESEAGFPEIILQAMFNITNQAFFMGMFFLISAYFTAASVNRKSTGKFLKDRFIRLGIPLVVFYFILNPLTNFINWRFIQNENVTIIGFITNPRTWGFGPMWFVEALLIFTLIFVFIRILKIKIRLGFPGTKKIIFAALITGLLQFVIRIWLPVGWSMPFTNFQFPFFVQYILLFIMGIIAYQNNWLESITFKMGKQWFIFAQIMILVILPLMLYFGGKENGIENFVGGITWQSFSWAIWEQLVGFTLIIGLFGLFNRYLNRQNKMAKQLSASAYGVFVFHAPIIVGISAFFVFWKIPQLLKFIVLAPVALLICFLVAFLFKKLPLVKKIL
ncbi:MAG TPA: acyltransferase family protein [Draconibacterium sp.]|nr:acyltransferase family protein [Draconibacterium sp.]